MTTLSSSVSNGGGIESSASPTSASNRACEISSTTPFWATRLAGPRDDAVSSLTRVIDLRVVRDDPDRVRASQRARGADEMLVDALLAADDKRRAAVSRADTLRAEQKTLSRQVGAASPNDRHALLAKAKQLADEVKSAEAEQHAADTALREAHLALPNLVEDGVPAGDEANFVTLELVGTPAVIENPRDHTEIGGALHAIDTERGAKVSGARFYFLTGIGAQLELALVNLAMEQAAAAGFTPVIAPALVEWEREFLDKLELAYRVIDVAAGDLGMSAARKYDIEAWFPSQGAYRELTSASNCLTFQARRLNTRVRTDSGLTPVATLNGTLCAVSRTIACLLDHHQQPDGTVYVPKALRPWLGGREVLAPA